MGGRTYGEDLLHDLDVGTSRSKVDAANLAVILGLHISLLGDEVVKETLVL